MALGKQATHVRFERSNGITITFDSKYEYSVYRTLVSAFGYDAVLAHPKVSLLKPLHPYPELSWAIDFQVSLGDKQVFVEAKSPHLVNDSLKLRLNLLAASNPTAFSNFLLVIPRNAKTNRATLAKYLKLNSYQVITDAQLQVFALEFGFLLP